MAELTGRNVEPISDAVPTVSEADNPAPSRAVRIWQFVFALIFLGVIGTLSFRLWDTNVNEQRVDGMAPDFTFTTFEGETISLADLKGKGVVINFWASWCDPCHEEAAMLEAAWRREKDNGIIFLGLDYLDQEPAAKEYLAQYAISYPNGPDLQSRIARRYRIKGVPETYFIDPEGKITQTVIGQITSPADLDLYLSEIRP